MAKQPLPDNIRDFKLMFPSKYLECADLRGREHIVTIEEIFLDTITSTNGEVLDKWIFKYVGHEKLHVQNVTNCQTIGHLYGRDPHGWVGKSITIYPTETRLGRETVPCIRIKREVPRQQANQPRTNDGVAPSTTTGQSFVVEPSESEQDEPNYLALDASFYEELHK